MLVRVATIAACSLFPATTASAQIIVNGGFDQSVPDNGTGGGWTSENISAQSGGWSPGNGRPGGSFVLNEFGAGETTDPAIFQTVSGLVAGETYTLGADYQEAVRQGAPDDTVAFSALIDGVSVFDLTTAEAAATSNWRRFVVEFVAPPDTFEVRFAAERNGTRWGFRIDNVAVVPAPGASLALAIGAAALCPRRRLEHRGRFSPR